MGLPVGMPPTPGASGTAVSGAPGLFQREMRNGRNHLVSLRHPYRGYPEYRLALLTAS